MDFMQFFDMILHVDKTLEVIIQQYGPLVYAVCSPLSSANRAGGAVFFPGDKLLFIAAPCAR